MSPSKNKLALITLSFGLCAALGSACSDTTSSEVSFVGSTELRSEVLENLGENVLVPSLRAFEEAADELKAAVDVLETLDDTSVAEARASYRVAFSAWQQIALMQIGPLATDTSSSNPKSTGENLGDAIYRPAEDSCGIDEGIVSEIVESPADWEGASLETRSLSALEYLLFELKNGNSCSSVSPINESGSWEALGAAEIEQRRLTYAQAVAQRVSELAAQLTARYAGNESDEQENFALQIVQAGSDSTVYDSSQEAFNAWATALVAIDTETRDMNLGKPAGIAECFTTCPAESRYSDLALLSIRRNVESLDLQLFGGVRNPKNFGGATADFPDSSAASIDDILLEIGQDELVDELAAALDTAYASLDAIEQPLEEAIETDEAAVRKAHSDLSAVVTLFKTDVVSLLNLEFTESMSDTD